MKDSGVDWIGMIPKHWEIVKLKYVLTERKEKSIFGTELLLSVSQSKGVIPAGKLDNRTMQADSLIGYKIVKKYDLIFNKLNPGLARFGCSKYAGITSPDFAVYVPNNRYTSAFLAYLLKTTRYVSEFKKTGTGVGDGFARLYTPQLFNFLVALPDIIEIKSITDYLKNKCAEIDSIIEDKQKQLDTLAEYRKSLIYEYVTGKKEVPTA